MCVRVSACGGWHPNSIPSTQLEFTSEKLNENHPGLLELFKQHSKNELDVDVGKISSPKSTSECNAWNCLEHSSSVRVEFDILNWEE